MDLKLQITPVVERRKVDDASAIVSDVESRADTVVNTTVPGASEALLALKMQAERDLADANRRQDELKSTLASLIVEQATKTGEANAEVRALEREIELQEAKLAGMNARWVHKRAELEQEIVDLMNEMDNTMEMALQEIAPMINTFEKEIDRHEGDIETLDYRRQKLEYQISDLEKKVGSVEDRTFKAGTAMTAVTRSVRFAVTMLRGVWKDADDVMGYIVAIMGATSSAAWSAAILSKLQGNMFLAMMQIMTAIQSVSQQTMAMAERANARRQAEYNQTVMMGERP